MTVKEATEAMLSAVGEVAPMLEALGLLTRTEVAYHTRHFRETDREEGARYISVSLIATLPREGKEPLEYALGMSAEAKRGEVAENEIASEKEGLCSECTRVVEALSADGGIETALSELIRNADEEYAALLKKLKYIEIGFVAAAIVAIAIIIISALL